jgi:chromosome segregation ATPase
VGAVCIIVLVSTFGYFLYENVFLPRTALTENASQLQNEINNKTVEIEQLNTQITDFQNRLNNLTQTIEPKSNDIVSLNSQINSLNAQLEQANQKIRRLTNELADLQHYIAVLQEGIERGPTVIFK